MNKMSNKDLIKKIKSMSDGETEYNWNTETGAVESHEIKKEKK